MKKNTMMRIASFLLIAVLLSTSAISGTYAKYVTKGEGSDEARVAKFGVEVTAKATMFEKKYASHDADYAGFTVATSSEDKLVAPGTNGDMVSLAITGTPEVATRITYTPNVTLSSNWRDAGDSYYCPLVIKVWANGTVVDTLCGLDYASAALFEKAIEDAIVAKTADYAPETNLSEVNNDMDITWEWPFEGGVSGASDKQTDEKDTFLGDEAADGNAATIKIELTVTVTQID